VDWKAFGKRDLRSIKKKMPRNYAASSFKIGGGDGNRIISHSRLDPTFSNSVRNPLEKGLKKGLEAF